MTEEWTKTGEKFTDTSYSDTLKKVNSMTNKTPHPHAGIIAEWIKDTSRTILLQDCDGDWVNTSIYSVIEDRLGNELFCFADTTEQKPKIVSSLTDKELRELIWDESGEVFDASIRNIANAAAQRAIEDLEVPPDEWFDDPRLNNLSDEVSLGAAIDLVALYLQDIKEGKL